MKTVLFTSMLAFGTYTIPQVVYAAEAKGKPAICQTIGFSKEHCTFIARNGNGSFDVITSDGSLSFDKVGTDSMNVTTTSASGRTEDSGLFTRSQTNRACWIQKDMSGKINGWCVW